MDLVSKADVRPDEPVGIGNGEIYIEGGENHKVVQFFQREVQYIKDKVNIIFTDYYQTTNAILNNRKISFRDQKERIIETIAKTHQRLERLHAFRDGNTRTNLLVLNKLLTEFGFSPVILEEPNAVYLVPLESWAREITKGIELWEKETNVALIEAKENQKLALKAKFQAVAKRKRDLNLKRFALICLFIGILLFVLLEALA